MSLTAAQLAFRKTGLAATDLVALVCDDAYSSPMSVYLSKVGGEPEPERAFEDAWNMQCGHAMEPMIMDALAHTYKLDLEPGETVRNGIWPWILATPDRFVVSGKKRAREACAEGKLVGKYMAPRWADPDGVVTFPESVAIQATWQMAATGLRRCYVGALLGDWKLEAFHHIIIDWNEDLWLGLHETGERFWTDHVLARVPPPADASDRCREALGRLYPAVKKPVLAEATAEQADLARKYLAENAAIAAAVERKEKIANLLRAGIGEHNGVIANDVKATWLPQKGKANAAKLAAHFNLSDDQLDDFRGEGGRVLRVAPLTKKEKGYRSVRIASE